MHALARPAGTVVYEGVAVEGGEGLGRHGAEQGGRGAAGGQAGVDPPFHPEDEDGRFQLGPLDHLIEIRHRCTLLRRAPP